MKLYSSAALPDRWIGEDAAGELVSWPILVDGWDARTVYKGGRRGLHEVPAKNAYGTGWPGAKGRGRPARAGAAAANERITIRLTSDERKQWAKTAGDRTLGDWIRETCNAAIANRP